VKVRPPRPACAPTMSEPGIVDLVDTVPAGESTPGAVVSYLTESTDTGTVLRRVACSPDGEVTSDVVVASDLDTPGAVATCPPGDTSCKQVKMQVSVRGCSVMTSTCRPGIDASPYQYELLGTRRST
jgi:hypothetical protein